MVKLNRPNPEIKVIPATGIKADYRAYMRARGFYAAVHMALTRQPPADPALHFAGATDEAAKQGAVFDPALATLSYRDGVRKGQQFYKL